MKKNKTLSIIIANYNNSKYLIKCIESILIQTYKHFEVIIFDDSSTDGSQEVLKTYEKKYPNIIKVIYSSTNIGVAKARHEAILQSEGEYITTLDSDDFYFNKFKLENEFELIKKYKKKEDIIAFSKICLVDKNGGRIGYQFAGLPLKEGIIINGIIARTCFIPRDFMFKKSIYFDVGGFDFNIPIYEDWDLKIRLSKKYKFYFTDNEGIAYRRHGEGLSNKSFKAHLEWMNYIFKKNINLIEEEKRSEIQEIYNAFIDRFKKKQ